MSSSEQQEDQRKDDAVRQSLRAAGIAKRFQNKDEKLSSYSAPLALRFVNGEILTSLKSGVCLYFQGDDPKQSAKFQLTCRAALLNGLSLQLMSLPTFQEITCRPEMVENAPVLGQLVVLAIQGFYDDGYESPFSEHDLYRMGWVLRERLMEGKSVILQGTSPIMDCKWWSYGLRQLLVEKSILL